MRTFKTIAVLLNVIFFGCSPQDSSVEPLQAVKKDIQTQLDALHSAAVALQQAAPAADANGWNAVDDSQAISAMRSDWKKARIAYERIEGAIAVLFPELDAATDERYDGFIEGGPDNNLFDGTGVTGIHAIERILWADSHPSHVESFEKALPHYSPAAFPSTQQEAEQYKNALVARLVADVARMRDDFAPLALDTSAAFRGVIGSMEEQLEKVSLASTGEDESRYAQHTLADMRANLAGGRATWSHFVDELNARDGAAVVAEVEAGFARVEAAYAAIAGDSVPAVPLTWNEEAPSVADLATPYGQLHSLLSNEANVQNSEGLIAAMNRAAEILGIPQLP